jgi:hypothetical protein
MAERALSRDPRNLPDLHHQVVGGDREAFVRAIGDRLDDLYRFVSRELRYREALGDLVPGDRRCGFTYPPASCGGSANRGGTSRACGIERQ